MATKTAQRLLRFLAGRFRDTQADGKVYALQNGSLLDVTNITQKALSAVPLTVTSAGQTVFSVPGGYTPGLLQVARNGILQSFTGTDGSTITLASGTVSTNDTVTAYVFATFQVANALMLSGGTMTGSLVSPGISMTGSFNGAPIVTLASAATVNIGAAAANTLQVTGTTTITAFDTVASGIRKTLRFSGALTLTYDATKLILPRSANITTVAGDVADFVSLGSGNWACVGYERSTAPAERADLGILSAATRDVASSALDITANRVLLSGAHGIGRLLDLRDTPYEKGAPQDIYSSGTTLGFARGGSDGVGIPSLGSFAYGVLTVQGHWTDASGVNGYCRQFSQGSRMWGQGFGSASSWGSWVEYANLSQAAFTGPVRPPQYTLATLPSASAYSGYEIDVTDAAGGAKRCRSDGSNWKILNTTTTVS